MSTYQEGLSTDIYTPQLSTVDEQSSAPWFFLPCPGKSKRVWLNCDVDKELSHSSEDGHDDARKDDKTVGEVLVAVRGSGLQVCCA